MCIVTIRSSKHKFYIMYFYRNALYYVTNTHYVPISETYIKLLIYINIGYWRNGFVGQVYIAKDRYDYSSEKISILIRL